MSSCPRADYGFFPDNRRVAEKGFTLPETLIAMLVLTFGLLAHRPVDLYCDEFNVSGSFERECNTRSSSKLDFLADLYRQNPAAADLTDGAHGPEQVEVTNPEHPFRVEPLQRGLESGDGAGPGAGKILKARQVTVTVTPVGSGARANSKASLNKVVEPHYHLQRESGERKPVEIHRSIDARGPSRFLVSDDSGFSLVEFVISSAILLVICASVFNVLAETQRSASYQSEVQSVLENTRMALETVERFIRQAGNDPVGTGTGRTHHCEFFGDSLAIGSDRFRRRG